ncbi:NADH:flavin oxidoreductase [Paenibacillus glycinis]|uniref:12-oxophytodienoate reductase n=1 Tax=Paenibacillus glycinis TaxID=2697035 RepID=A0ABW9XKH9_9BACL|nr:NADH:flavin oxidoreductase [Paenibacillus glycinis]NBD23102.1 12-oxophytodienoate reductase [Paenibacillus glycinis]
MNETMNRLLKPFASDKLSLKNRIVMAPLTRSFSPNGVPGENVAHYYRRRAENQVGLIITEGTVINDAAASGDPDVPRFHGKDALDGWAKVVEEVHAAGAKIVPQIWHVGMTRASNDSWTKPDRLPNPEAPAVGPSGIEVYSMQQAAEPLTEERIRSIIAAYGQAAADAKRLGFDGVEIHGAHSYLIDEFFWEKTNRRTDKYGGDFVQRTRFAVEVIEAVRKAVGPEFPIIFRMSQWKLGEHRSNLVNSPEELAMFLKPLVEAGVDLFHVSTYRFYTPEFDGSDLNLAGWVKKLTGKPTIAVGSVGLTSDLTTAHVEHSVETNLKKLADEIENETYDLVAVGRALLADPAWVTKTRDGRSDEIIPFVFPESLRTLS